VIGGGTVDIRTTDGQMREGTNQVFVNPLFHVEFLSLIASFVPIGPFIGSYLKHDIALIHVDPPFDLSAGVSTVRVANAPSNIDGMEYFVGGYGITHEDKNNSESLPLEEHSFLYWTTLPAFADFETCNATYNGSLDSNFHFCAGGVPGQSTCHGDSGGPVWVAPSSTSKDVVQYGLTSLGLGCGGPDPGVYIRVDKESDNWKWANETMQYFAYQQLQNNTGFGGLGF